MVRQNCRSFVSRCALALLAIAAAPVAQDSRYWNRAYEDGVRELEDGRFADAERSFRHALSHPASPSGRTPNVVFSGSRRAPYYPEYFLAIALQRQGKHEEALQWFERVQQERLVPAGSGEAKALAGHLAETRKALAARPPPPDPKPPPESPFDTQLKQAEASAAAGRPGQALKMFDALRDLDAAEFARRNLGARRDQLAQQLAGALVAEGDQLRANGQLKEALTRYRTADSFVPGAGAAGIREVDRLFEERAREARVAEAQKLVDQGEAVARAGRYSAAAKLFRQAAKLDPDNAAARVWLAQSARFERMRNRGRTLGKQGQVDAARSAYESARREDEARFAAEGLAKELDALPAPATEVPAEQMEPVRTALVAYLRGDAQQAVQVLEKLSGDVPDLDSRVRPHVYAWLGVAYGQLSLAAPEDAARSEMRRKALEQFRQLIAVDPDYDVRENLISPRIRALIDEARTGR